MLRSDIQNRSQKLTETGELKIIISEPNDQQQNSVELNAVKFIMESVLRQLAVTRALGS